LNNKLTKQQSEIDALKLAVAQLMEAK